MAMLGDKLADLATRIARLSEGDGDGSHPTAIAGLSLHRAAAPTALASVLYEPTLCVVAQGRKRVILGDEVYAYDPAHFLLVSVDLPLVAQVIEATAAEPYLGIKLDLDLAVAGEALMDADPADLGGEAPGRGVAVSTIDLPLLDAVARLVGLLDEPRAIAALAPLVRREITYRLLIGPQGARLRRIAAEGGQARRIARAIDWLRHNFARPLRVEEVARGVHMSPSSFHQHFKAVTALSPLQYQKRLRLHEARRLMLAEALDAAAAAYRVGYESPSQFNRDYRRTFGEPPARDLARLKAAAPPARG